MDVDVAKRVSFTSRWLRYNLLSRLDLRNQISQTIGERQHLQSIFQIVARSVEESLPIDFGCVCRYDQVRQLLTVAHVGVGSQSLAMELALTEQADIPVDKSGLSRCVWGRLVYEPDITEVQMPFLQRLASAGLRSLVAAP